MKLQFTLLSLFATLATVSAVTIRGFPSYSCPIFSVQWVCYNIPAGTCCLFPRPIRSMRWTLPTGTRGIGYAGKYCTKGVYSPVYGPRTNSCFNYAASSYPVYSAKWQNGTCIWQWKRSVILEREECAIEEGCVEPTALIYSPDSGKTNRTISVPAGSVEKVATLLESADYKSLASFSDLRVADLDNYASVDTYDLAEGEEVE